MQGMTIGIVAREGGVGVETVRYYQRRGLIGTPPRAGDGINGGIRRYDQSDLRRLRFIRSAQAAGFTLDEIAELLALDASEDRARARALAGQRIAALDAMIADLTAARAALRKLASECASGDAGPCPIIAAFDAPLRSSNAVRPEPVEGQRRRACSDAGFDKLSPNDFA